MWGVPYIYCLYVCGYVCVCIVTKLRAGLKNVHLAKCADYLAKKQNRAPFPPRPLMRRKTILELVHNDLCYVDARSHSGGPYFVTFIDDHRRKLWPYMRKTKDQVLRVFKEFQARSERESG